AAAARSAASCVRRRGLAWWTLPLPQLHVAGGGRRPDDHLCRVLCRPLPQSSGPRGSCAKHELRGGARCREGARHELGPKLGPRLQSPWAPQVTVRNLLDWLRSPAAGGHEAQDHATSHAEHCPFVPGPASSSGSRFAFDLLAFLTGQVALQVPEVPDPPALRSSAKGRSGLLLRALSGCRADEPVP
ncbi:unnamed protein product, partial [Polarella glacialis]